MHVQVNTSNGIEKKDALERWAADYLNEHLARFAQDITAIEVQLTDENSGDKAGNVEKRCMMEARIAGHAPVAVTNFAPDQNIAFRGAAEKLSHALEHKFGKLDRQDHRARDSVRTNPEILEDSGVIPK